MKPSDLLGRWSMVSFTKHEGGREEHPLGRGVTGLILYTADGGMAGFVLRDPALEAKGPPLAAYAGNWELKGDDVHHHATFNTDTERAGTVQVRRAHFEGPNLVLETPAKGPEGAFLRIVWRRP